MTVTQKTRKAVYKRDHDTCIVAGFPTLLRAFGGCWGGMTVQHLTGRGMGGSSLYDTPEHLVTMCAIHNALAESDSEFARVCRVKGWSRDRNAKRDPRLQPVNYGDGWYHLEGDTRALIPDADAIEYLQLIGVVEVV